MFSNIVFGPTKFRNECLKLRCFCKSNPIRIHCFLFRRYFLSWHFHFQQFIMTPPKVNCSKKPFRVSIEGNIGSGKSSLIQYFQRFPFVKTYEEPLDKWCNLNGYNLLGLLYQDLSKWNSTFQSYVQLTRTQIQSSSVQSGVHVQMFERSVQNNRYCFMENAYRDGILSPPEYQVLRSWYEWIEQNVDISLDLIVYLRSSPEVVYERIKMRNRPEERSITREYLQSVHEAHEHWLNDPDLGIPVCVIDADSAVNKVHESYEHVVLPLLKQPILHIPVAKT